MRTVAILTLCAVIALAEDGAPKKGKTTKKSSLESLLTEIDVVDLGATNIQRLGTNPIALYARVAIPSKGEFETSAEYEVRAGQAPEGPFAIRIETDATYSTSESAFMVKPKTSFVDVDLPRGGHVADHDVYQVMQTALKPTAYIGQNAFGVKKLITRATLGGYYLRSLKDSPNNIMVIFSVDREKAMKLKQRLHLYAICRVPHGYVLPPLDGVATHPNSIFHSEPTISEPNDLTELQFVIDAEISQLWLVNELTGEVLAKAPYANAAD